MSMSHKRLIGTAAVAALTIAGAMFAWRAASDSPEDLAQLSDAEKLEIINGDDADAVAELLEAEEAAAQAEFARRRLERRQALAEIEVQRSEAKERGAAYWDDFDPDSIDLTGFDFDISKIVFSDERDAKFAELPVVTDFERASEMTFPPSKFDCNPSRFADIGALLKSRSPLPMAVDRNDVVRMLDYLGDRAALATGDCSCATQAVPIEAGWQVVERLATHPSGDAISGTSTKDRAISTILVLFRTALEAEVRSLCKKG